MQQYFQTGQETVTGAGVLREDDMAALLAADTAAVLSHILIDILVAHGSLSVADALFIKSLVQTKVGHNSRDRRIGQQLAMLLHVTAVDVQNVVASNNISFLVHTHATVSITVIGKTNIQPIFYNKILETFNVGRTGIVVNVQTIRLIVDNVGICAEGIKDGLRDVPTGSVGAVQTDPSLKEYMPRLIR